MRCSPAAALRIGWLAVPPQLMDSLVDTSRQVSAWPSSLDQIALARFIEAGLFDRHIRRMRGVYRQRRDLLIARLAGYAPMLRVAGIAAGGHALARLPPWGPGEDEVVSGAGRCDLALEGLAGYRFGRDAAELKQREPALVIGRSPWKNSHRLRTDFQSSGGCSGSQRPVARLMGTLKITVEVSAAMSWAPTAGARTPERARSTR